MSETQKKLLLIITAGVIFVSMAIIFVFLSKLKTQKAPPLNPSATITVERPTPTIQNDKPVDGKKLRSLLLDRPTPSTPTDITIKQGIIADLGGNSGTLTETQDYAIRYLKAANQFEGEIKTKDFIKAKEAVVAWFEQKGMTHEGVCKLPLIFFLNFDIQQQLKNTNVQFA